MPEEQQNPPEPTEGDVAVGAGQDEQFTLDVLPDTRRVQQTIEIGRAHTANVLAYMLVGGAVFSLLVYLLTLWIVLSSGGTDNGTETGLAMDAVHRVFDKWYAIISPLAGAAVGAYYGGARQRSKR